MQRSLCHLFGHKEMKIFTLNIERIWPNCATLCSVRYAKGSLGAYVMISVDARMQPGFVLEGFILPTRDWIGNTRSAQRDLIVCSIDSRGGLLSRHCQQECW